MADIQKERQTRDKYEQASRLVDRRTRREQLSNKVDWHTDEHERESCSQRLNGQDSSKERPYTGLVKKARSGRQ